MQLKKDAIVSHSLALINNGLSTVNIKLLTDENHFSVARVTPALSGVNEFTTLHPSDSVHVSLLSHSLSPSLLPPFSLSLSHTHTCIHMVVTCVHNIVICTET